jgi:hypothetical protein
MHTPKHAPPPLAASRPASPEAAAAAMLARTARDAQVRGVVSIAAMRDAIRAAACALPTITAIPRVDRPTAAAFRARAALGLPFLITGIAGRWPLHDLTPAALRDQFGHLPVRARVGDYIHTAFAPDRAMQDMSLLAYLDLVDRTTGTLPPYLGNLELRALNRLCHWPTWFDKMGPPRFWLGPAGTVTPLHCDYDDNLFAQVWGTKRIFLAPPHHDAYLYPKEANAILSGSPFDPEAPDFDRYPLARAAGLVECIVAPGEMLYVPAGWYHQVRALTFSLSSNRWARAMPAALDAAAARALTPASACTAPDGEAVR